MDVTAINSNTACRNLIFYATNPFLPVAKKSLALYSFLKKGCVQKVHTNKIKNVRAIAVQYTILWVEKSLTDFGA